MIIFILLMLLCAWYLIETKHNIWSFIGWMFVDFFACGVIVMIISFFVEFNLKYFGFVANEPIVYETPIYSLKDSIGVSGQFSYGTGRIDSEIHYYYLLKTQNGEKIDHVPGNCTYLQYFNEEHPHIETHKYKYVYPTWATYFFWFPDKNSENFSHYILVLPEEAKEKNIYEVNMQ